MRWMIVLTALALAFPVHGQSAGGPAGPPPPDALAAAGMTRLPDDPTSPLPAGLVETQGLRADPVDATFSNLEDLAWLAPVARSRRVVLLGESHYFQAISRLGARILFALNTYDRFGLVSLELPYSATPWLDHYVGLARDEDATAFRRSALARFVYTEETAEILDAIRRWNALHPDRRIHVGAHDLEHDYATTLKEILAPYFRGARVECAIPASLDQGELEAVVEEVTRCAAAARRAKALGAYGFVTPAYVEAVVENLRSTARAYRYELNYYRQRAIIRNLTAPRFLGELWRTGKLFLWTGGYHAPTHLQYPDGGNFLREGSYLTYDHAPTRGKTYSIRVDGYGLAMEGMAGADLDAFRHTGRGYRSIVGAYNRAAKAGAARPDGFYLFGGATLDPFDLVLLQHARASGDRPFRVTRVDWDGLAKAGRLVSPQLEATVKRYQDDFSRFDAAIVVPRSLITRAIPLPAP